MKLTTEQLERRRANMEVRKAARAEMSARRQVEKEAQLAALRKVRDAEDSTTEMRLEAVKMIEEIRANYYYL